LPKQQLFLASNKPEVMYSGGFGSGKTRALCYKTWLKTQHKNNFIGLCRKTFTSLRHTTLRTLIHADGNLPPVLPEGTYKHYKTDHIIKMYATGAEIYYFGFDDPYRIASAGFGSVGIDEAIELDENEYTMLLGRLRNEADPHRQIYMANNPSSQLHFLYKRFYLDKNPNRELITAPTTENVLLPKDYLDLLNEFTGQKHARYVLGQWCDFEGLIYEDFDPDIHIKHRTGKWHEVFVGVDEGYANPMAILFIGMDGDGRYHVIAETYKTQLKRQEQKRALKTHPATTYYVDPSAAALIGEMREIGLHVVAANNSVFDGIQSVKSRLVIQGDGLPRLTIEPTCVNLIRELQSYQWKPKKIGSSDVKDEPVKEFDHAVDALRYAIHTRNTYVIPRISVLDTADLRSGHEQTGDKNSRRYHKIEIPVRDGLSQSLDEDYIWE